MPQASVIVVGNEKGGAGKSTIAIHTATALLHAGASVAVLDLDLRQQSTSHFFANRRAWLDANGVVAPMPIEHPLSSDGAALAKATDEEALARFEEAFADLGARADFVLVDTPGSDTAISRAAHGQADLIVTPMNDSFVDFDMLGVVDPVTLELKRHSLYSETVWNSRKARAVKDRKQIDWVVLRNRLAPTEARNRKRLEERIETLSRKVGFRIGPGLRDRVIYRELFPFGLTVADLSPAIRPVAMSLQHVAARQELRALMTALGISGFSDGEQIAAE
ncbi:division plane positioning ATPase MipZ [Phenylobacterium sp.]|uniref:division plane positioning ATPase MipZ n=1 Tax=Phenylobacterium sp. TaxID=1871053 RepID=UPI002E32C55A|nr:division plane positioning ATPase MipZ [Phenylobacterium sp.]HEX4711802.1 division plane positioning ATPase MipZ [Phenylobacterium sp.]